MKDEMQEFIARLTDNARTSLQQADAIARNAGSSYIGTEHLLLGVLTQQSSVGAKILADVGITYERAELALNLTPRTLVVRTGMRGLSETALLALKMGWEFAKEFHQEYMGTEHILYSLLEQKNARATVLLRDMSVDIEEIKGELQSFFDRQRSDQVAGEEAVNQYNKTRKITILSTYGTNLTDQAAKQQLDPVIGRTQEIERLVTVLSRRTKNNPVLIGEPGVGKTAIVEGLAEKIVRGEVPEHLLDKRVWQLDLAGMIAGTKYRGEFEERLKKVLSELKKQKNFIVFIDELHLLVGAGAAEGALDAANMLKPALARGEIRLIGATTLDEYRKHIEKDSALERRFQSIVVKEPAAKDTIAIIKGLRGHYEKHHHVTMSDEVIETAVGMAERYINDRYMPDKAIDVIDEAAALKRVRSGQSHSKTRDYTRQIKNLNERMEDAALNEDYERAALYKTRISQLAEKLEELRRQTKKDPLVLDDDDIARAIAVMTTIPVERVQTSELALLTKLEQHLSKYVIGQYEAIRTVAEAIRRGRSGISSAHRPIGSFVFMGPTGVGKTEMARVIAREVFGSEDALIKIDMSEFGEKHTTSRLIGAPAGYIGYEDGGKLTDKIRRQPYSVVLFDEIEKAHRDVFQLLLQLLEDGKLTDAKGRSVDFSHTIVILTSNLGASKMTKDGKLGFTSSGCNVKKQIEELHKEYAEAAEAELSKMMRPELINRFDSIITFNPLSREDAAKIFNLLIADLNHRLVRQGVRVQVMPGAKKFLIEQGFDEKYGVRSLRRVIEKKLEHKIAEGILLGKYQKGTILKVRIRQKQISVETGSE